MIAHIPGDPAGADARVAEWLAHVEAGRLGPCPPLAPAIAKQREANDALFRARAARHAAALRATRPGASA